MAIYKFGTAKKKNIEIRMYNKYLKTLFNNQENFNNLQKVNSTTNDGKKLPLLPHDQ